MMRDRIRQLRKGAATVEMAFVVWRADMFPTSPDDPKATRVEWPLQRYHIEGGFRHAAHMRAL